MEEEAMLEEIEDNWIWTASVDYGFQHPFVYSLWCSPPDKSKIFLFKEIYRSQLDPGEIREMVDNFIKRFVPAENELVWTVADHRPEMNKYLRKIGIPFESAQKQIIPGIALVKQYLKQDRIFFNKNSLSHPVDSTQESKGYPTRSVEEFDEYRYKPEEKMTGSIDDEKPIQLHDDFLDTLRYQIVRFDSSPQMADIEPEAYDVLEENIYVSEGLSWI